MTAGKTANLIKFMEKKMFKSLLVLAFLIPGMAQATVTLPEYWKAFGVSQYQHSGSQSQMEEFVLGDFNDETSCNTAVANENGLYPAGTNTPAPTSGVGAVAARRAVDAICHQTQPAFQLAERWYIVGGRQVRDPKTTGKNLNVKIGPFATKGLCDSAETVQKTLTMQPTPFSGSNVYTSLKSSCKKLK